MVTVPGTRIQWLSFSRADNPRSLLGFLIESWTFGIGLRGYPEALKINEYIASSCPELKKNLIKFGVELIIDAKGGKKLYGSLMAAQKEVKELGIKGRWSKKEDFFGIDVLNKCAHGWSNHYVDREQWHMYGDKKSIREASDEWMELDFNKLKFHLDTPVDWEPGKWISSWDANMAPAGSAHFRKVDDDVTWLLSGNNNSDSD